MSPEVIGDRKSTRLNSSHVAPSYAVFCLKKKKRQQETSIMSQAGSVRRPSPSQAATALNGVGTRSAEERPNLPTLKPPEPPTYEGARQGTFTQWAFQVKQYLRL